MAIYPKAKFHPLGFQTQPRMSAKNRIILHTMGGGTLESTDREFRLNGYKGLESHFGVGADGEVIQWQDTNFTADANSDANTNSWSIETEDGGRAFPAWSGDHVPAWLKAQADSIIDLVAWLCKLGDIPVVHLPDSKAGRRGIAGHRQGINSSPPGQPGYRKPGTETWSQVLGKICPGDRRYAQIDSTIIPGVKAAMKPGPPPVNKSSVYWNPDTEDEMFLYREASSAAVWLYWPGYRTWIQSPTLRDDLVAKLGVGVKVIPDGTIEQYGVLVGQDHA